MGLNLGKLLRNVGTLGTTWMRDQRQAKKKKKKADRLQQQALADAEEFRNRDLGSTAFAGVRADPALQAAQQRSLARTEQISNEGYTDVDRQAMNQQLNDVARYEQSQRQSLAADARARGVSGSGMDIMSQLAAQQAGADRAMQTGTDMAIAGRDRAQQANAALGQQAGAMRDQGFGEQATVAGATDQYAQWRAGTQAQDFAQLQAARGIQAGNLQQQAGALESTPNLDAAANAVANYYTAGAAGNVAGSAPSNGVAAAGAPPSGATAANLGGGGGAKSMGASPMGTQKAMPGGTAPPTQAPAQQPNPAMPPNPRPGSLLRKIGNARRAARPMMNAGGGRPAANAVAGYYGGQTGGTSNPYRRPRV